MGRRVTEVNKSDRSRVRMRGHWGRAARLRQSQGSGSGQRKLHVRLRVAALHFVFPFFQHRGLKMVEIFGTMFSFFCLSGIAMYYLKLMYKFTFIELIHVFVVNQQTNLKACSQFNGHHFKIFI